MRLKTWSTVLALCLCSGYADAGGFSLNGRELGQRIDGVLNDPRYECGGASACLLYTVCALKIPGSETLADAPLQRLSLHFGGERLTAIEAQFPPERFEQVLGDLIHELGPAEAQLDSLHGNAQGTAGNALYVWREGSQLLRLERTSRHPARSSLIITQKSFLSELLEH
jgi:hypothetical protein